MSLRVKGNRLPSTQSMGLEVLATTPVFVALAVIIGLHFYNKKKVKDHKVSKRGRIVQSIGNTELNDQIEVKNHKAHRMSKLFAGGKFEYSKNSVRDHKSTLYRK